MFRLSFSLILHAVILGQLVVLPCLAETTKKESLAEKKYQQYLENELPKKYLSFQVQGKNHRFLSIKDRFITITSSCGEAFLNNQTQIKCLALQALNKVSLDQISEDDLLGGKNPGSVLCKKSLKATVVFGLDLQGNTTSFCAFTDGTMVSSDTLSFYGEKNKNSNTTNIPSNENRPSEKKVEEGVK